MTDVDANAGVASVTGKLSLARQQSVVQEARSRLVGEHKAPEEVFRRLWTLPVIRDAHDPSAAWGWLEDELRARDKAKSGAVSPSDLRAAVGRFYLVLADDECSSLADCSGAASPQSISITGLLQFLSRLSLARDKGGRLLDALLSLKQQLATRKEADAAKPLQQRLQHWLASNAPANCDILRSAGILVSESTVAAVSLLFEESADKFWAFVRSPDSDVLLRRCSEGLRKGLDLSLGADVCQKQWAALCPGAVLTPDAARRSVLERAKTFASAADFGAPFGTPLAARMLLAETLGSCWNASVDGLSYQVTHSPAS